MQGQVMVQAPPASMAVIYAQPSCTPMLPGTHWHMRREDFVGICKDRACADALRYFEVQTDYRIKDLRDGHRIPDDVLPSEDDLWIRAGTRELVEGTQNAWGHSMYALRLQEDPVKRNGEALPSLLRLGFLRRRFIAARTGNGTPATVRYRGTSTSKEFIIVDDEGGGYIGDDGEAHNATEEGFRDLQREYLYCIEAVNAALYGQRWLVPPVPPRRWEPVTRRSDALKEAAVPLRRGSQVSPMGTAAEYQDESLQVSAIRGNSRIATTARLSDNNDNMDNSTASMSHPVASPYDLDALCTERLTPETLIGLASVVLDVPLITLCDEDLWETEWYEPAREILANSLLTELPEIRQWEIIDLVIRYMATPGSPSWWQRPYDPKRPREARAKKTPITLKHVAKHLVAQYADFQAHDWFPDVTTKYDGPSPVIEEKHADYGAGYGGVEEPQEATEAEVAAEESDEQFCAHKTEEEPMMSGAAYDALVEEVRAEYPVIELRHIQVAEDGYILCVLCDASGRYLGYGSAEHWHERPVEDRDLIECQAVPHARSLRKEEHLASRGHGMPAYDRARITLEILREYPTITVRSYEAPGGGFVLRIATSDTEYVELWHARTWDDLGNAEDWETVRRIEVDAALYSGGVPNREMLPEEPKEPLPPNPGLAIIDDDIEDLREQASLLRQGMDREDLRDLADWVLREYPAVRIGSVEIMPGQHILGIKRASRSWIALQSLNAWNQFLDFNIVEDEAVPYGEALLRKVRGHER